LPTSTSHLPSPSAAAPAPDARLAEFLLDKPRLEIEGTVLAKTPRSLVVHVTGQLGLRAGSQVPSLNCCFGETNANRTAVITGCPQQTTAKIGDNVNLPVYLLDHSDSDVACSLKCYYMAPPVPPTPAVQAHLQQDAFHGDVLSKSAGVLLVGEPVIVCSIVVNHVPGPCWQTGWKYCLETGDPDYATLQIGDNVVARGYITGIKTTGTNTWINLMHHNFFGREEAPTLINHQPQYTEEKIRQLTQPHSNSGAN
jgi:hypothetical protein